ncbi:MAG: XRE family transcriptional regulator [Flavobacteriia bacterium]|nr:XRE family transcriptional regulator [Flavobacteriia bacterium]
MAKSQLKDQALLSAMVEGLKQVRKEQTLTQEDVYNDTGIHISRIETGRVNLSLSTLKALLDYYKITLSAFFTRIQY